MDLEDQGERILLAVIDAVAGEVLDEVKKNWQTRYEYHIPKQYRWMITDGVMERSYRAMQDVAHELPARIKVRIAQRVGAAVQDLADTKVRKAMLGKGSLVGSKDDPGDQLLRDLGLLV